jgi:hypothetical protein
MNLIDVIHRNHFLKVLFPDGLNGDILVGQFGLDVDGRFSLNLHTTQAPAKAVPKWGDRGKDYDVIVIKLLGSNLTDMTTTNWKDITPTKLSFSMEDDTIRLICSDTTWSFSASFETLIFQSCSTYLL